MPDYTHAHSRSTSTGSGGSSSTANPAVDESNAAALDSLHGRFAGDANLEQLLRGPGSLSSRHNGESVRLVQQALMDLGYSLPRFGADGSFGSELRSAISDFQGDQGLEPDGKLGKNSLAALSRNVPAAGAQAERFVDYGQLLADGKLEITVAFGYDEHDIMPSEILEFRRWVTENGFTPTTGDDANSEYFTCPYAFQHGGSEVSANVVLRVIVPNEQAKESYTDALQNDEVVYYAGHARYGSGPDFDHKDDAEEHFNIGANSAGHESGALQGTYNEHMRDVLKDTDNDLERVSADGGFQRDQYQVWVFGACSTINYLDELRGGLVSGKDTSNLDILGTGEPIYLVNEGNATIAFIESLIEQDSIQKMIVDMNAVSPEAEWWQHGAGGNPAQR
jgi:hypothetical protein